MDLKFVDRIIKATLILALIFAPMFSIYIGFGFGLSILLGAVWGSLNLLAIKIIITSLSPLPDRQPVLGIIILFIKLPVLYILGYLLVSWKYLSIHGLLWGFSGVFIVALLKVLGRQFMGMNNSLDSTSGNSGPKEIKV